MDSYNKLLRDILHFFYISKFKLILLFFLFSLTITGYILISVKPKTINSISIYPLPLTTFSSVVPASLTKYTPQNIYDDFIKIFSTINNNEKSTYSSTTYISDGNTKLNSRYDKSNIDDSFVSLESQIIRVNGVIYNSLLNEIIVNYDNKQFELERSIQQLENEIKTLEESILRKKESELVRLKTSLEMAKVFNIDDSYIVNLYSLIQTPDTNNDIIEEKILEFDFNILSDVSEDVLFLYGTKYLDQRYKALLNSDDIFSDGREKGIELLNVIENLSRLKSDENLRNKEFLKEIEKFKSKNLSNLNYVTIGESSINFEPNRNLMIILSVIFSLFLSVMIVFLINQYNQMIIERK